MSASGQVQVRLLRGPDQWVTVLQTEEAQYKLDGLILVIGRWDGRRARPCYDAGVISYDDQTATYRMRAFDDGRFLESEVKLLDDGKGIKWGFSFGEIKTSSTLRITNEEELTEAAEITFGSRPAQKLMELKVEPAEIADRSAKKESQPSHSRVTSRALTGTHSL